MPTTSPSSASSTDTMSVEAGYVGNHGAHVFVGDGPAATSTRRRSSGFGTRAAAISAKPFFARYGWTQGIDYFCNCAHEPLRLAADEVHQAVRAGLLAVRAVHAAARSGSNDGDHFFIDPDLNYGTADWDRNAQLLVLDRRTSCRSRQGQTRVPAAAGSSTRTPSSRAACRSTSATATRARIATPDRTVRT